jgi:hypothetical protein
MLTVKLNLGPLIHATDRLKIKADVLLEHAVADLAAQTHAHIVEQASNKLHSTRQKYVDALSYEQVHAGLWTVTLDNSAMWIEEGMPRHEMIDDLLKNGAQVSKKTGARYRVIPLPIKGKTQTPTSGQAVRAAAMKALRSAKINMKDIEKEVDGRAKIGTLHKLDEDRRGRGSGARAYRSCAPGYDRYPVPQGYASYAASGQFSPARYPAHSHDIPSGVVANEGDRQMGSPRRQGCQADG